jgi:putative membrane protein
MDISQLPAVNASLNAVATCLIVFGFIMIRRGNVGLHRVCMVSAVGVSALFLTCYLVYHFKVVGVTRFSYGGWPKGLYYFILFTHIPLAIVCLPLVGLTVIPALQGDQERHKRWARWTLPIWLYVSVTGVLVYFMLYVWFAAR